MDLNDRIAYSAKCPVCMANRAKYCRTMHGDNVGKRASKPHKARYAVGKEVALAAAKEESKAAAVQASLGSSPQSGALNSQVGGDHYKTCKIQPVQFIEANGLQFLEGCVVKRVTRHNKPSGKGIQDIDKAIHELELIKELRYPG